MAIAWQTNRRKALAYAAIGLMLMLGALALRSLGDRSGTPLALVLLGVFVLAMAFVRISGRRGFRCAGCGAGIKGMEGTCGRCGMAYRLQHP